jgi:hypothetical protein
MALDGLYVPASAPWLAALRSELLSFPAGKHDDCADVLGLIGQLLDTITSGSQPDSEPEKPRDTGYRTYEPPGRLNDWLAY